jgi:hypothetical protein
VGCRGKKYSNGAGGLTFSLGGSTGALRLYESL